MGKSNIVTRMIDGGEKDGDEKATPNQYRCAVVVCIGSNGAISTRRRDSAARSTWRHNPFTQTTFEVLEATGNNIEIRGVCASACTLVLSYIPKERLCFAKTAWLGFHQYSQMVSGMITEEIIKHSRADYDSYPQDIREWLEQKGGFEKMPRRAEYWKISAPELWKMGYRKCEEPRP